MCTGACTWDRPLALGPHEQIWLASGYVMRLRAPSVTVMKPNRFASKGILPMLQCVLCSAMEQTVVDMRRQIAILLRQVEQLQGREVDDTPAAGRELALVPAGQQTTADDIIGQQLVTFSSLEVRPPDVAGDSRLNELGVRQATGSP